MAILQTTNLLQLVPQNSNHKNPNSTSPLLPSTTKPLLFFLQQRRTLRSSQNTVFAIFDDRNSTPFSPQKIPFTNNSPPRTGTLELRSLLLQLATSAILFVGLAARACPIDSTRNLPALLTDTCQSVNEEERDGECIDGDGGAGGGISINQISGKSDTMENVEDEELKSMLESWKSKTFALTVPLRVVALRGSIPPTWIKDFIQSQGKRLKLRLEFRGTINDIFSDLSSSLSKGKLNQKAAMAADIVSVGDSWLSLGINKRIIEPIEDVEGQDWFKGLSEKWKVYLCRNSEGQLDSVGKIWAAPYRWGSIVIAYKKNKFQKHNMAPIEDWKDLWRPELAGKISMVDSPREVIGAVLKYMGASYNTEDIDSQVTGGRNAVLQNLMLLQKQVRLFDSVNYLKAFGVGDVWVAVGWSSDVLPAAKRLSNVAVVVPKSGASLWADLWVIPAASKFATGCIGGRVRGPSPLIHQWVEFCLQAARALPFQQEVIPGSSPFSLEDPPLEAFQDSKNGKPKLDTDLISGAPPSEILAKCEFLEPLTDATLMDFQWLIDNMQKPGRGLINNVQYYISSMVQGFRVKPNLR